MGRRIFSREFKLDAVKLVRERGVSVVQASRDLDVAESALRRWIRDASADPQRAFPGHGQMTPEQQEIKRLRKKVAKLKAERDILKKATANHDGAACRSTRASGLRPRCQKTSSTASSRHRGRTKSGLPTLPISGRPRAGCTSPSSSIYSPAVSLAGR